MRSVFVIAGLGNPGKKYANSRHNVGFDTIDLLGSQYDIKVSSVKHKGLLGEGIIQGEKVVLVKPQTFMNLSGECVAEVVNWYKVDMRNVILIYDDIDIELGKIRIRPGGSSGTHNGMKSVIYHLKSDEFPRIRVGIGKPGEDRDLADYVLAGFGAEDRELVDKSISNAADAAVTIIKAGIDTAMNKYN